MSQYNKISDNKISHIYNPANQNDKELIKNFVVRKKEFNKILNEIKDVSLDSSAQHFLVEGQRGTGKTSLLLRLQYEIKKFNNLVVVQFSEEQYNIFDLSRLWESSAEALEDIKGFENISNELDKLSENDDYTKECFYFFEKYLIKNKKRLLLLLDNFGDILDKLSDIEQKRLRDILHTSNHIQLIASSSRALEHTYKHDKAFFEFFNIIRLKGLNKEETNILLNQLSKNTDKDISNILTNQSNRVETIRRLTSGIPRTIVLLFEIFLDDSANVFEDLELILDRVTPLYKHRMDDLATKQQAIMDTVAMNWDGITSREIVQGLNKRGFDTKGVSALLKVLEKNDLVLSKKIDKKNKLYMLKERFFNIWYLMRYGRKKNKSQVRWLVEFLKEWCDKDELEKKAKSHIRLAKEGKLHPRGGVYMGEALACVIDNDKLQYEILNETKKALRKFDENIDKKMSVSDIELFKKAVDAISNKKFDLALKNLHDIKNKNEIVYFNLAVLYESEYKKFDEAVNYYKMAIEKGNVGAMYNLAILYKSEYKNFDEATKYYKMAIKKGDAGAMNNLAILYQSEYKNFDEATVYYKMAIKKGNSEAMFNLAFLYQSEYKNFDEATVYYKMAIKKGDAGAMNNLAILYQSEYKNFDEATKYYKMAIKKGDAGAMNNLAILYQSEYKNFDEATVYYKMAIKKGNSEAMFNLAILYQSEYKNFDEATVYYKMAIKKGNSEAMFNLAILYQSEYKNFDEATVYYKMAIKKGNSEAMFNLAILYQSEYKKFDEATVYYKMAIKKGHLGAMNNLAFLYKSEYKNFDEATVYYKMAIKKGHLGAMNNLAYLYFEQNINKNQSLALINKSIKINKEYNNLHSLSMILLFNDKYQESIDNIKDFIKNFPYTEHLDDMTEYLIFLIAKKQYHLTYNLFEEFQDLKMQFKPIYYALMEFLKNEYPKEYLKQGEELKETIEEILKEVKKVAKKYK